MSILEYFIKLHPVVIHFVIVGYILAPLLAFVGLLTNTSNRIDSELMMKLSVFNFWLATLFYPIAAITGMIDARSLDRVISTDLLALKMVLGFVTVLFIFTAILSVWSGLRSPQLFDENLSLLLQYLILSIVIMICIIYTSALGGMYVFGHSLFDTLGLSILLPTTIDQPTNNLFETSFEAIFFSPLATGVLLVLFLLILILIRKMN